MTQTYNTDDSLLYFTFVYVIEFVFLFVFLFRHVFLFLFVSALFHLGHALCTNICWIKEFEKGEGGKWAVASLGRAVIIWLICQSGRIIKNFKYKYKQVYKHKKRRKLPRTSSDNLTLLSKRRICSITKILKQIQIQPKNKNSNAKKLRRK